MARSAIETNTTVNYLTSRNANRPSDDPIFALNTEAMRRRAAGERVINATVGALLEDDGTLAILPSVFDALREVPPQRAAGYAPIGGVPDFLGAVIKDLLGGTPLEPLATAVATPGGSGALRHAISTFLDRGQTLVTSSFYWGPYATLCDENERTLTTFNMFDANGGFDIASFAATLEEVAQRQGRVLLFLNDPCHNPTGYSMSDREWGQVTDVLARIAERVPLAVLTDVAYIAYARDQKRFLAHLAPLADKAMLLFAWSTSKTFTQYGLRVGAIVAVTSDAGQRAAVQRALAYASRGTWSNVSAGGQWAIARCLTDATLRARVDAERDRLKALLSARVEAFNAAARGTGLKYPRYDGGFFVTLFVGDGPAVGERLKARGVFAVPQKGAVRVALCSVAESDVRELVSALDASTRD